VASLTQVETLLRELTAKVDRLLEESRRRAEAEAWGLRPAWPPVYVHPDPYPQEVTAVWGGSD
jgi:hypothetical protein